MGTLGYAQTKRRSGLRKLRGDEGVAGRDEYGGKRLRACRSAQSTAFTGSAALRQRPGQVRYEPVAAGDQCVARTLRSASRKASHSTVIAM